MECHEPITKRNQIIRIITKFTQSNCDMCVCSPCVIVCEQNAQTSHIKHEKGTQKKNGNCGTKWCLKCQMSYGLTYKHRVVHSHQVQGLLKTYII